MSMLGDLLGGIGQGLRAGSGVLNEQVFQNNEALRQNQMQAAEARKAKMFEYVWQGIQGGSIDPQQGLRAMAQIDPNATQQIVATLGGGIGPSLKARQALAKQQRELQVQAANDANAVDLGGRPGEDPAMTAKRFATKNPAPSRADTKLVTLTPPGGGSPRTFRQGDPQVDALTGQGWTLYQRPPPVTKINLPPVQTAWQGASGKTDASFRQKDMEAGQSATDAEGTLLQMAGILKQAGSATGTLQPLVLPLQGVAADLGVDIDAVAKNLGINIGNLANKEQFDSLAANLVITVSTKFKGALNQKELQALKDSQAGLGKSEEGNRMALAAALAAAKLAQERGAVAAQIGDHNEYRKFFAERSRGDAKKLKTYRDEYKQALGGTSRPAAGVKEGTPPPAGVSPEVWSEMTPEERALWQK